ncbi:MAG: EAL domain-containing protein [Sphaerochaeta sp.]|nr:EAL domain-containing protein [Sphaerochaeta sp.]
MKILLRHHLVFASLGFIALVTSLLCDCYLASAIFCVVFLFTTSIGFLCANLSEPWSNAGKALHKWLKSHQNDLDSLFCLSITIHAQGLFQSCIDRKEYEQAYEGCAAELSEYFGINNVQRTSHDEFMVIRAYPSNNFNEEREKTDYQGIVCQTIVQRLEHRLDSPALPPVALTIGCAGSGLRYQVDSLAQLVDLAYFTKQTAQKRRVPWLVADAAVRAKKLDIDECKQGFLSPGWQEEFNPFFQPIIETTTQTVVGVESLARWQLGGFRILSASVFKDLACDLHHITTIDIIIITKTLATIRRLMLERIVPYTFKVVLNISNESLKKGFADRMVFLVEQAGLHPMQIEFDIKDSALSNPESILAIRELREKGFSVSLDVFTETAFDLQAFVRADFDCIKLDFAAYSAQLQQVYAALYDASIKQDITVLAKGIENKEMLEAARELGCPYVQGNYFTLPVAEHTFRVFMQKYQDGLDLESHLG